MFKRILAPVDGSDAATRALDAASDLAVKCGAELLVLHVAEDIPSARVGLQRLSRLEHLEDSEREALSAIADPVVGQATSRAHEQGVQEVQSEIRLGKAAHEIMAYAGECGADLIVMGRRGLGPAADLLLGSVSSRVTERADCACLTVK